MTSTRVIQMNMGSIFLIFGLSILLLSVEGNSKDKNAELLYEAKILNSIIRMELKMEMMAKELKTTKAKVKTFTEYQKKIYENRTATLQLLKERQDKTIIAFSAYNPVDISPATNQIIVWQSTRLNEGNAYNNTLGTFKAPIPGLYYFAVHACHYKKQTFYYAITLDGFNIASTYKYDKYNEDCDSISTVTFMRAEQRVWVRCTSGSSSNQLWESSGRSSFVGVLLHS